jgi:hypothetical protein
VYPSSSALITCDYCLCEVVGHNMAAHLKKCLKVMAMLREYEKQDA